MEKFADVNFSEKIIIEILLDLILFGIFSIEIEKLLWN